MYLRSPRRRREKNYIAKSAFLGTILFFLLLVFVLFLNSGLFILAYALVMLTRLNSFETLRLKTFGNKLTAL